MINEEFEWSDVKAASNIADHGVTFEQATGVFDDPFAVEFTDDREDYGEERLVIIGMTEGRLLTVVFTEREHSTRIISARKPEPYERRMYHEENDL